jgi:hypothetical protein
MASFIRGDCVCLKAQRARTGVVLMLREDRRILVKWNHSLIPRWHHVDELDRVPNPA